MDCLKITKLFWCNLRTGGVITGFLGILDSIFLISYFARFHYDDLGGIFALVIFMFIMRIICHGMVLIGVYTTDHIIMIPYLIIQGLFITAYSLFIVVYVFIATPYALALLIFVLFGLYIGIQIAFYMTIYSNYLLFKQQYLDTAIQQALNGANLIELNLIRGTAPPMPPDYEVATTHSKLKGKPV